MGHSAAHAEYRPGACLGGVAAARSGYRTSDQLALKRSHRSGLRGRTVRPGTTGQVKVIHAPTSLVIGWWVAFTSAGALLCLIG